MQSRLQTGFTLLELVLVLLAIAILATLAVPRWSLSDSTLHAQAAQLARDIRHIQMLAMNQGRTLTFQSLGGSYRCVDAGSSIITDPATQQPFSFTLKNAVTLSAGTLSFDSLGRPVNAGALLPAASTFSMTANTQTANLSIAPITGFVTVTP